MLASVVAATPGLVATAETPLQESDPASFIPALKGVARVGPVPGGVIVDVDKSATLVIPFPGATQLTFDIAADGIFLLTWFTTNQQLRARVFGPPWRYLSLAPGQPRTLDLNLLATQDWFPAALPGIRLQGTGNVRITRVRWRSLVGSAVEAAKIHEASLRFAPDAVGQTTINGLLRPAWSQAGLTFVPEVLGFAGVLLIAIGWAAARIRRKGWSASSAAAVAIVAVAMTYDLYALMRLVPAMHLRVELDPERRIRDNYYFSPEIGALASLARAQLGRSDKVGVQGDVMDWFGPQTLCFNLAPRPCVVLEANRLAGVGISSVRRLGVEALDAVLMYNAPDKLVNGFTPSAQVNRNVYLARRIP
jgi:hypothetical protein